MIRSRTIQMEAKGKHYGPKRWMFDPGSGGKKIPGNIKREVTQRIEEFAAENYAGKYTRLDIRFRGQFCYNGGYGMTQMQPQ
ncbi:MAG: hypothetical protein H6650_07895 [Ardenticatenales bacterium]|nr:hypothetical protein [Ardenticatenales bacterium]